MKKKTKTANTRDVLYIRNLDPNIKAFFKAHCAKRGVTMTQRIGELILEAVQKENK